MYNIPAGKAGLVPSCRAFCFVNMHDLTKRKPNFFRLNIVVDST